MKSMARVMLATLVAFALTFAVTAGAQTQKIAGSVVGFDGATLQLRTGEGTAVAVKVGDSVRLSGRSPSSLDRIVPGVFLGTTAVPRPDGMLSATEVHIFPESMRGTGEGHRPMDTAAPGSTMTNATVSAVAAGKTEARPGSTMTNATVGKVAVGLPERQITLTYAGGEKVVAIPPHTPIVMVEPADRSMLVPGAHVIVYAAKQADGSLAAERITIGRNGFVPPM